MRIHYPNGHRYARTERHSGRRQRWRCGQRPDHSTADVCIPTSILPLTSPRGRVPSLLLRMRFLTMTAAGRRAAASLAEAGIGDASQASVVVTATDSMGVLDAHGGRSFVSRSVSPAILKNESIEAALHFEEVRGGDYT